MPYLVFAGAVVLIGAMVFVYGICCLAAQAYEARLKARESDLTAWMVSQHDARLEYLDALDRACKLGVDERGELLNRIKPETFQVPLSQGGQIYNPPAVRFDDDQDYFESKEEMALRLQKEIDAKMHMMEQQHKTAVVPDHLQAVS